MLPHSKLTMTWLSYLTRENYDRRIQNYRKSMESLRGFADSRLIDIFIIDNAEQDNDTCEMLRDEFHLPYSIFKARNSLLDVSAHYVALELARSGHLEYFAYAYDDIVFYDHEFVGPAIEFMDSERDVSCIRLSKYEHGNMRLYDTQWVPKDINPESVDHKNSRCKCVMHKGPFIHGSHTFYKSNWHPISKPTLWRKNDFETIIGRPSPCPTLQAFEKHMYDTSDQVEGWTSGFIDGGVCTTFPQQNSERLALGIGNTKPTPSGDIAGLLEELCNPKCWS